MTDWELWTWGTWADASGSLWSDGSGWVFIGYRRLTLEQVLRYEQFGYVVRKVIVDRSSTIPLFPLLGRTGSYPVDGLDQV